MARVTIALLLGSLPHTLSELRARVTDPAAGYARANGSALKGVRTSVRTQLPSILQSKMRLRQHQVAAGIPEHACEAEHHKVASLPPCSFEL